MPSQMDEQFVAIHPALTGKDALTLISGKYEFSYEFAYFLTKWGNGHRGDTLHHYRNFQIAQRKGCFNPILINDLGYLTEAGKEVYSDARNIMGAIRTYYDQLGITPPNPENADLSEFVSTDLILVYGSLPMRAITYLTLLYGNAPTHLRDATTTSVAQILQQTPNFSHDPNMPGTAYVRDGKYVAADAAPAPTAYLLTGSLHHRPAFRHEFERLIRYGFATLDVLPKHEHQKGRGRAPVGAKITEMGIKFFENYVAEFDPSMVAYRTMQGE